MGLVAREIEKAGFSTVMLSNIPELTAAVGTPRIAAIEYPIGLTMGRPGDEQGQLAVLRATLRAVQAIETPGGIEPLPFEWDGSTEATHTEPAEPPPIVGYLKRRPWLYMKLLARDIPH